MKKTVLAIFALFTLATPSLAKAELYPLCPVAGGLCGYVDNSGSWVIYLHFDEVRTFADNGLARVNRGGRWGFIDTSGTMVIAAQFDFVRSFSDGLAAVQIDDNWSYINENGETAISLPAGVINAERFSEGLAPIHFLERAILIDTTGQQVLEVETSFRLGRPFNGVSVVYGMGNAGAVDTSGNIVIERQYNYVFPFREGLAAVQLNNGSWGFLGRSGHFEIEPIFDHAYPFTEGLARVQSDGLWGFIDRSGRYVIEPKFELVGSFTRGLAPARIDGFWGLIDSSANWVLDPVWHSVSFRDMSMIKVEFAEGQRQGYLGIDGTPLTFSPLEIQAETNRANSQRESGEVVETACDHVYVGQRFEGRERLGGIFTIGVTYEVQGFSSASEMVTVRSTNGGNSYNITCSQVTP